MQFFDRLIPLMAKKPNLLDKVITVKDGMDKVKDSLGLFLGKLTIIQSRMKVLTNGFHSLIISIINSNNEIKDWAEWSNSFDNIVNLQSVAPILEGEVQIYLNARVFFVMVLDNVRDRNVVLCDYQSS